MAVAVKHIPAPLQNFMDRVCKKCLLIFFLMSRLAAEFPPELTAIPLEDIDPYYQNKKVYTPLNQNF